VVIGGYPHERKLVFDASEEATACGIRLGMPLREAHSLCPEALFLTSHEEVYQATFETLLNRIAELAPKIESTGPGEVFIEIPFESWENGIVREVRQAIGNQERFSLAVGCASGKFTAQVGSRIASTDKIISVPDKESRSFLAGLPIDFLPGPDTLLHRLELLGVRRMGQLACLPREEVSLAFGAKGEWLWELARGIDRSRVIPHKKPLSLSEQLDFDPPAEMLDRLLMGAGILADRLAARLDKRWQHCQQMMARVGLEEGTLDLVMDFRQPTSSARDMLRQLEHHLGSTRFTHPVARLEITVNHLCAERCSQLRLLDTRSRHSESLLKAIHQLQAKYGRSVIRRAVRPDTFSRLPEAGFALVDFG